MILPKGGNAVVKTRIFVMIPDVMYCRIVRHKWFSPEVLHSCGCMYNRFGLPERIPSCTFH